MTKIKKITPKMIDEMNYVDFISFLKETNRCPGGKRTINWILQTSLVDSNSKILEVGSNTGFSSLEAARTLKASVIGIDPVESAVREANETLSQDADFVQKLVTFKVASAYDMPVSDGSIDLIIAGGSTSFMDDKKQAISEMHRVLKPWGFLSFTNLYYYKTPPSALIESVSSVIGTRIEPMDHLDWKKLYLSVSDFEVYAFETVRLNPVSNATLASYIDYFLEKPHIKTLDSKTKDKIKNKWYNILKVFNENHEYLGFIRALLRKRTMPEEPELFKVKDI
jgi:ubiquinone/menaquinone biosynthesis C-methylase UbiE